METNENGDIPAQPVGESGVSEAKADFVNENKLKDFFLTQLEPDSETQQQEPSADSEGEVQFADTPSFLTDSDNSGEEVLSEDSQDEEVDDGLSRNVQKRIDTLTAKRKQAEEEAARLKTELDAMKAEVEKAKSGSEGIVIKSDPANPYAHLNTIAEIENEASQARSVRRWCEEHAEGVTWTDDQGVEREYTSEDIKRIKLNAIDALEEHLPKRMNYVHNKGKVDQVAETEYKWWKDRSSKERQIAEAFIKALPEVTRFPDYKLWIGDLIQGMRAREARASGSQPKVKAPVQPNGRAMPQARKSDASSDRALNRFTKTRSPEDFAAVIASRFI